MGEIGAIKKNIAYSRDVLITAARIQAKCNEMNAKLLISRKLLNRLSIDNELHQVEEIESTPLKGKSENVTLYKIR